VLVELSAAPIHCEFGLGAAFWLCLVVWVWLYLCVCGCVCGCVWLCGCVNGSQDVSGVCGLDGFQLTFQFILKHTRPPSKPLVLKND
jgi:hypothetical protein